MNQNQNRYPIEYFKNYVVQGFALGQRFLTLLIVVPALSVNPELYGVYALCVSVLVFLSYVDLGFLASSAKYAAESFAQDNRKKEMELIGFGGAVTLTMTLILSIVLIFLSINPEMLIVNLPNEGSIKIASNLLLTLALFSPVLVLQRILTIIFEIRLQGYVSKIVSIVCNFFVIISTLYFFSGDNYFIVEYFIFLNFSGLVGTLIMVFLLKKRFNYDLIKLFFCFKFSKRIYENTRKLAYPSMLNMISWIAFYELDQLVVGRFIGAKEVAFFAIGLTFAALFRSIFGIIFAPLQVRANYYVGKDDDIGLKGFLSTTLIISAPITILPTVSFCLTSEALILSWVGHAYKQSIVMAKLFSLLFTFSFISYVAGIYLTAKERVKELYMIAIFLPFIYWFGIILTYQVAGIFSFPVWKLLTVIVSIGFYINILSKSNILSLKNLCKEIFLYILVSLSLLFLFLEFCFEAPSLGKSTIEFFRILVINLIATSMSIIVYYLISADARNIVIGSINKFKEIK